jgi:hypothetical protein
MVTDSAAVVVFAIRSGIRLGQQIRKGYIDATKRRDLVLPLPKFFADVDPLDEAQWFHSGDGQKYQDQAKRLQEIITKFGNQQPLTEPEKKEVHEFYRDYHTLFLAERGLLPPVKENGVEQDFPAIEVIAWVTVRQWAKGTDPNPSTLQRLAGTFIEIGVDYFATMPGALHKDSGWGKAMAGFLEAMDRVDFAEGRLTDLPERLLVAGLETLAAQPELLTGDAKVQELIKVAAQSLSEDVATRLAQIDAGDLPAQMRVKDWAELTFRSVLGSAGRLVVGQPERYLGMSDAGRGALVAHVGSAVLGLVLDQPDKRLDHMFSRAGLETVIKAALTTLGEHPEILGQTENEGLRALLSQTAKELSGFDTLLNPDVLPEMLRLVLEKSAQNLDLIWPDLKQHPETNLALTTAQATLAALSQPIPGVKWKLRFTKAHLVRVTETVIDELVANPQWLLDKAGAPSENLEAALRAVLKVLSQRGDERISPETGVRIMEAVVRAVVLRQEFIQRLADTEEALIVSVLDTLIGAIFNKNLDPKAAWQLIRSPAIAGLTEVTLRLVSRTKLTPTILPTLKTVLKEQAAALAEGELFTLEAFEKRLTLALAPT